VTLSRLTRSSAASVTVLSRNLNTVVGEEAFNVRTLRDQLRVGLGSRDSIDILLDFVDVSELTTRTKVRLVTPLGLVGLLAFGVTTTRTLVLFRRMGTKVLVIVVFRGTVVRTVEH